MALNKYRNLKNNKFRSSPYEIIPIRLEDKDQIRKWRNEQMFHLRQSSILTEKDQEKYFNEVISKLFIQDKPNQILFSFLKDNNLIGYGGLVHIDWGKKKAEISFLIDTSKEEQFVTYWKIYLSLIEKVAFIELNLDHIYTFSYNLRPLLYDALEESSYLFTDEIKEAIQVDNMPISALIHTKQNPCNALNFRLATKNDTELLFKWANDETTREQSFNSEKIKFDKHVNWFNSKLNDSNSDIFIAQLNEDALGMVRFDLVEDHYLIGVSLDNKFRGKGIAAAMIRRACELKLQNSHLKKIKAKIKSSNIASIKSFTNAGFQFDEQINSNKETIDLLIFTV